MTDPVPEIEEWLADALNSAATSWSVGTFGALAEFAYGPDDPVERSSAGGTRSITSDLGALRLTVPAESRLFAYEGLSKLPAYWSQGISLCMPDSAASLSGRSALTVIGEDQGAIRPDDRPGVLVDLGVGAPHIEACVRIADEQLLRDIEPWLGKSLFTEGHAAAERLYEASPHRVFRSAAARIEVYGPIPQPGGATPPGPHTHLLPDLLRHDRAFAANTPIPVGWLPVLNAYPPNPARDTFGEPRSFDREDHRRFQRLIDAFGVPGMVHAKARIRDAVRRGMPPDTERFDTRFERIAARVALRQMSFEEGPSDTLLAWQRALEPGRGIVDPDVV
ncbi:MAG: hypothetical protein RIC16_08590 [Rhodospirillales bacterium]